MKYSLNHINSRKGIFSACVIYLLVVCRTASPLLSPCKYPPFGCCTMPAPWVRLIAFAMRLEVAVGGECMLWLRLNKVSTSRVGELAFSRCKWLAAVVVLFPKFDMFLMRDSSSIDRLMKSLGLVGLVVFNEAWEACPAIILFALRSCIVCCACCCAAIVALEGSPFKGFLL